MLAINKASEFLYAMTGDFGYYRAILPYMLRKQGYIRCASPNYRCSFLLVGVDHPSKKVTETLGYKKAKKLGIKMYSPIQKFGFDIFDRCMYLTQHLTCHGVNTGIWRLY